MGKDEMKKDLSIWAFLRVVWTTMKKNWRFGTGWVSVILGFFLILKGYLVFSLLLAFGIFYTTYVIWRKEKEESLKWDREAGERG